MRLVFYSVHSLMNLLIERASSFRPLFDTEAGKLNEAQVLLSDYMLLTSCHVSRISQKHFQESVRPKKSLHANCVIWHCVICLSAFYLITV